MSIAEDENDADLWLLNSCTVKNPSQDSFHNAIHRGRALEKYVVVAGCVPQGQPRNEFIKGLSVVGVSLMLLCYFNLSYKTTEQFVILDFCTNDNAMILL